MNFSFLYHHTGEIILAIIHSNWGLARLGSAIFKNLKAWRTLFDEVMKMLLPWAMIVFSYHLKQLSTPLIYCVKIRWLPDRRPTEARPLLGISRNAFCREDLAGSGTGL